MTETQLSRDIQTALRKCGVLVVRVQSGRVAANVHGAVKGTPDLWFAWGGHQGWLEVKTPTGKLSAEQRRWHDVATHCGAFVRVVRSVGEAIEAVTGVRRSA